MRQVTPHETILYGPVASRRLGRSLGINLFPGRVRVCTFNCLYCHHGRVQNVMDGENHRIPDSLPDVREIHDAVKRTLQTIPPPDAITFSGNGEPTIHPQFPEIVEAVRAIRDELSPTSSIALLTNGSTISREEIRRALKKIDKPIIKLDAGLEDVFQRLNRPNMRLSLDEITAAISELDQAYIQTLLVTGTQGNTTPDNLDAWLKRLIRLKPIAVQITTLTRQAACTDIAPLFDDSLKSIKQAVERKGITVQ